MSPTAQRLLVSRLRECEARGHGAYLSAEEVRIVLAHVGLSELDATTHRAPPDGSPPSESGSIAGKGETTTDD